MNNDLFHYIGSDLTVSGAGGVQPVNGTTRGQQRVLRRLLTNPGEYIFHPDYGAGLPSYVGRPMDAAKMRALVRSHILLEDSVAKTPDPEITVKPIAGGAGGGIAVAMRYHDADTGQPVNLSFNVGQ